MGPGNTLLITALPITSVSNYPHATQVAGFRAQLYRVLALLPKETLARSEAQEELYKYIINLITVLHLQHFRDFTDTTNSHPKAPLFDQLALAIADLETLGGWCRGASSLARVVLNATLGKVLQRSGFERWRGSLDDAAWQGFFPLLRLIQFFVFFTPVDWEEEERIVRLTTPPAAPRGEDDRDDRKVGGEWDLGAEAV
jgi:hypothetical protein